MAAWNFVLTRLAERALAKLDNPLRVRVLQKLHWLIRSFSLTDLIPLSAELKGFFKLRIGDWRIVYEIDYSEEKVIVHSIGHRDKIYKK